MIGTQKLVWKKNKIRLLENKILEKSVTYAPFLQDTTLFL